jgi:hypothetical protein
VTEEHLDPARDAIQRIREQPNWTENLLFVMYAAPGADGLAAWAHWSRVPARPRLWEGILALYLPGGELLLHRSFGPAGPGDDEPGHGGAAGIPDGGTAGTGSLSFRSVVPLRRWSVRLDGMMRRTSTAEVSAGPLADGPWEPVRFAADFEGIAPTWSARGLDDQEWADGHLEQPGRITGSAVLGGRELTFETHGFRDHSYGPRDYAKILGDAWLSGVFPSGRSLLAIVVWTRVDGVPPYVVGFVDDASGRHPVTELRLPRLAGVDGSPAEFTAEVVTPAGTAVIEVAMTHRTNFTMDNPVGMTLGTRSGADDLIAAEGPARLRWDSEETDGWIERFLRRDALR